MTLPQMSMCTNRCYCIIDVRTLKTKGGFRMTQVWIVRHGQTDWNLQGKLQGWTDIPLNANGVREAHALGFTLQGIPIHSLYSSDLVRAYATATILGTYLNLPVLVDTRLREVSFGAAEGTLHIDEQLLSLHCLETDAEVLQRALDFLAFIHSQHAENRVLCVSHGRWIRTLVKFFSKNEHPVISNTSVTSLISENETWRITNFLS
ncbi:histidine phosphatase family protein [Alicyclobacillaceae bacterium I2511]|nr:histidine phosphatase family protein [Alicyclobacillaceae bacterium I2511]